MKIKTLELLLDGTTRLQTKKIKAVEPHKPTQRNTGNKYDPRNRSVTSRWLADIFFKNEILAYDRKAWNNTKIRNEFLLKFKRNRNIQNKFKKYKRTIGMYRNLYNKQQLYQTQPPPYLMSFSYDLAGYIVVGGHYPNQYLPFIGCYQRCVKAEIADPRFIPPEYITELRNRQLAGDPQFANWIVPNEEALKEISKLIDREEIYNSVKFYRGYTREETPADWSEEE